METNKLFEALEKKAIDSERAKIQQAVRNLVTALRHPSGSSFEPYNETVTIIIDDESESVDINVSEFFRALEKQLVSERKDRLVNDEVSGFMKAHQNFSNKLHQMEEYLNQ